MPRCVNARGDGCDGLLVLDKPVGLSSMAAVARVRRAAGGVKTGHAGTLDPLASGVLICCLGRATKSAAQLMALTKVYEADVDLSAFTATDDREGEREDVIVVNPPSEEAIRQSLVTFVGEIQQRPPAYSAVHVGGQRAYKLARRGKSVVPEARMVHIDSIELLAYHWPCVKLRVTCGKGTYIRSLARDVGLALGTGGHLAGLRRVAVGPYDLSIAVSIERLERPITQADLLAVPTTAPPTLADRRGSKEAEGEGDAEGDLTGRRTG